MPCIHKGKTKCTYCSEILNKPISYFIKDWYVSQAIKEKGELEKYYSLKAWVETKNASNT